MSGRWRRLYNGETTVDFSGRRWWGFGVSIALLVITVVSLLFQGLNLGIDFKGGVAWEAPATKELTIDSAREVLESNGVETANAKIQTLGSGDGERIRIQVGEQTPEVRDAVQGDLAAKSGVDSLEVSVSNVSSSWGRSITEKAIRALLVFFLLVSLYIAWRFEWKMAIAAIAAMVHDVAISVGIYSLLGFEVTPATVIAFLTILGFSLYDTIVVFDKVKDNADRYAAQRVSYADITNVSMNQVLMRSLNTSLAAVLPVLSLLVLGAGVFGAVALQEFALALFVGLLTGAYSSIFIATPLLTIMKEREPKYRPLVGQMSLGTDMSRLATTGAPVSRRSARATVRDDDGGVERPEPELVGSAAERAAAVLTHPPRPRKKRKR
ncbi:MAG: protein translocase subunit SecF [Acidobacteria bacterium]|nr:protein translocase subunit SecF [Acidobacteriota bacterium]